MNLKQHSAAARQLTIPEHACLLTAVEVAVLLRLSVSTIRSWILNKRNIPYTKCGDAVRFRRADVEAFIAKNVRTVR